MNGRFEIDVVVENPLDSSWLLSIITRQVTCGGNYGQLLEKSFIGYSHAHIPVSLVAESPSTDREVIMAHRIEIILKTYRVFQATYEVYQTAVYQDHSSMLWWIAPEMITRLNWLNGTINDEINLKVVSATRPVSDEITARNEWEWTHSKFCRDGFDFQVCNALARLAEVNDYYLHSPIYEDWCKEFDAQVRLFLSQAVESGIAGWTKVKNEESN